MKSNAMKCPLWPATTLRCRPSSLFFRNPSDFKYYLQKLLDTNPSLQGVSEPRLRGLLDRWAGEGDVDQYVEQWPLQPGWQQAGWQAYARALAKTGHERDAVTTALHFIPASTMPDLQVPPDLDSAENRFRANPQDLYSGILLYSAQKSKGLDDQALNTLVTLAKLPHPPAYITYLLANGLLQTNQDEAAWQVLQPLLNEQ
jgi:hypothetical protein